MFAETGDTNVTRDVIVMVHFLCRSERIVKGEDCSSLSIVIRSLEEEHGI